MTDEELRKEGYSWDEIAEIHAATAVAQARAKIKVVQEGASSQPQKNKIKIKTSENASASAPPSDWPSTLLPSRATMLVRVSVARGPRPMPPVSPRGCEHETEPPVTAAFDPDPSPRLAPPPSLLSPARSQTSTASSSGWGSGRITRRSWSGRRTRRGCRSR